MKITARQAQLRLARSVHLQTAANFTMLDILANIEAGKEVEVSQITVLTGQLAEIALFSNELLDELEEDEKA